MNDKSLLASLAVPSYLRIHIYAKEWTQVQSNAVPVDGSCHCYLARNGMLVFLWPPAHQTIFSDSQKNIVLLCTCVHCLAYTNLNLEDDLGAGKVREFLMLSV